MRSVVRVHFGPLLKDDEALASHPFSMDLSFWLRQNHSCCARACTPAASQDESWDGGESTSGALLKDDEALASHPFSMDLSFWLRQNHSCCARACTPAASQDESWDGGESTSGALLKDDEACSAPFCLFLFFFSVKTSSMTV